MFNLGPMELGVILLIVVVIFGANRIPKLGRAAGETIREFRKVGRELTETRDELEGTVKDVKKDLTL